MSLLTLFQQNLQSSGARLQSVGQDVAAGAATVALAVALSATGTTAPSGSVAPATSASFQAAGQAQPGAAQTLGAALALGGSGASQAAGADSIGNAAALLALGQQVDSGSEQLTVSGAVLALVGAGMDAANGSATFTSKAPLAGTGAALSYSIAQAYILSSLRANGQAVDTGVDAGTITAPYVPASDHWLPGRNQLWRMSSRASFAHLDERFSMWRFEPRYSFVQTDFRNWVGRIKR